MDFTTCKFRSRAAHLGAVCVLICAVTFCTSEARAQLSLNTAFTAGVTDGNANNFVSAVLPDGKILVGGNFAFVNGTERYALARLNSNGTTDTTFNVGGLGPNSNLYDIEVLGDGKLLVGGAFSTYNGTAISGLARLNADGTLDTTFNVGGVGTIGTVQNITVQSDGRYIISGSGLRSYNGTQQFCVIRVNTDGTRDATFTSPFTNQQFVEQTGVQSDGKVVIGGVFALSGYNNLARLTSSGALDTTFNPGGAGPNGGVFAVHILSGNKILAGGNYTTYNGIPRLGGARLNADGTLDGTFNPPQLDIANAEYVAVKPNGQYLIAGAFIDEDGNFPIALLNTDGSPDLSFNPPQADNIGYHIALQPDGKILLTGWFRLTETLGNLSNRGILRLNADGTRDTGFQASLTRFATVGAMLQQPDGKYVVAGNFNVASGSSHSSIARFNADGTIDNTFQSGVGVWGVGAVATTALARQADGKILLGGNFYTYDLNQSRSLVRLNADGSYDASYVPLGIQAGTPTVNDLLMLPDGKVMVAGFGLDIGFQTLKRLNSDGTGDDSFAPGNGNGNIQKVLRQPDGKLIVVGNFTSYGALPQGHIMRLNTDGSLDFTFVTTGAANAPILTAALLADGKILIGGGFTTFNGVARNRIARVNSNGSLDTTFAPVSGADASVGSIAVQPDGKLVIGGGFTTFDGVPRTRLARLNADGTLDPSADSGIVNDFRVGVSRLLATADSEILVGGTFASYGGIARSSLAKLQTAAPTVRAPFDYDGDGKTDFSVFRPSSGAWYLQRSTAGFQGLQFGADGDKLTPADYDGDGKTDIAIYRPSTGLWYILNSSNGTVSYPVFGVAEDLPAPGDYDGDGKADLTVFRPSQGTWYRTNSSNGSTFGMQFGANGDVPTVGDFDGDGKNDLGIFRPSIGDWYNIRSSNGSVFGERFGQTGDRIAPADYDGDGKTDIAIYRPSTGLWVIRNSATATYSYEVFGAPADIPTAGDYDGDGRADIGVWRPSDGTWYIKRSDNSQFIVFPWGQNGDKPTPSAYGN